MRCGGRGAGRFLSAGRELVRISIAQADNIRATAKIISAFLHRIVTDIPSSPCFKLPVKTIP